MLICSGLSSASSRAYGSVNNEDQGAGILEYLGFCFPPTL